MTAASNRNAARRPVRRVSDLNADYSLPAGRCWPMVEARRLSIRWRLAAIRRARRCGTALSAASWIGQIEAFNLSATLTRVGFARPMTSQFAAGLLCAVGGRIRQLRIGRRLPTFGGGTSGDSPLR